MTKVAEVLLRPESINHTEGSATITSAGSVTVSSVSGVSFNNVFTAAYSHYKIVAELDANSGSSEIFRMRSSLADDSTDTYTRQLLDVTGTSVSTGRGTSTFAFTNLWAQNYCSGTIIYVFSPFLAENTCIRCLQASPNAGIGRFRETGYILYNTKSFDGFTIYGNAIETDRVSGQISVYGLVS